VFVVVKKLTDLQDALDRLCGFLQDSEVPFENVFDSKLVVSELVTNALTHSKAVASFESEVVDGFIRIKVSSSVKFVLPEKSVCSDVYAEHGRGLYLVDSVCESRTMTEQGEILITIKIK
jgi:anti-sigma regulatory factor (Ser/Thr protein kinase)